MQSNEQMMGAMWFIPMMLLSKILFITLYTICPLKKRESKLLLIAIITGIVSTILYIKQLQFSYNLQTAILVVPFICLGSFYTLYRSQIEKHISKFWWPFAAVIMFAIIIVTHLEIDLACTIMSHPALFFPCSILGISFCISLAKFFTQSTRKLSRALAVIGKDSFHIMALHFLIIKLIDLLYACITHNYAALPKYPYAFSQELWPIYYIGAVIIPVLIVEGARLVSKHLARIQLKVSKRESE